MSLPLDCFAVILSFVDDYHTVFALVSANRHLRGLRDTFVPRFHAENRAPYLAWMGKRYAKVFKPYFARKSRVYDTAGGRVIVEKYARSVCGRRMYIVAFIDDVSTSIHQLVVGGHLHWHNDVIQQVLPGLYYYTLVPQEGATILEKMARHRLGAAEFRAIMADFCAGAAC